VALDGRSAMADRWLLAVPAALLLVRSIARLIAPDHRHERMKERLSDEKAL
jgi:hypothetical protein